MNEKESRRPHYALQIRVIQNEVERCWVEMNIICFNLKKPLLLFAIHKYICAYTYIHIHILSMLLCPFIRKQNVHKTHIYFITTNIASACLSYEVCALMPPMYVVILNGKFLIQDFYEILNESFCWQICINKDVNCDFFLFLPVFRAFYSSNNFLMEKN